MIPETITIDEVAEMCHCSHWTVKEATRKGEIPVYKHCRKYRYEIADVEEWFKRQKANGYVQKRRIR